MPPMPKLNIDPSNEALQYMRKSPNQAAVDHLDSFIENRRRINRVPNLLENLANLAHGPAYTQSLLDWVLEILHAQYYDDRDSDWAIALQPWECRLLGFTVGTAFSKAFCTRLYIPFDGCYTEINDVGRLDGFLTNFGNFTDPHATKKPPRGAMDPAHIKEIVFYQDPAFSSAAPGSIRDRSRNIAAWHYVKRFEEDLEEGKLPTVTPKRARLYEKLAMDSHTAEMENVLRYHFGKIYVTWIRIIDLFKSVPNLEIFRWKSNGPVAEVCLPALARFCKSIKVVDIDLSQEFGKNEYALHAWNRLYQDEPGGRLYQSKRILDKPVAMYLCNYIAEQEEEKTYDQMPEQCRVSIKITVKTDSEVSSICSSIGAYCRHVQSLSIDRTKSLSFLGDSFLAEHGIHKAMVNHSHQQFGVSHLSLTTTGSPVNSFMMRTIEQDTIESLEIKNCQSLKIIYESILQGNRNKLRKLKISFPPMDEAKERAYNYWKHYTLQKRLTLDLLRCGLIELDELDIRGDFGEPALHPLEFSGLSPDLFFAIEAQAPFLVRLYVVNNNIDFSLSEIAGTIRSAPNLTQLGVTCRAFAYDDGQGGLIQQGLGTEYNFPKLLHYLGDNGNRFSLTVLRTHYNDLEDPHYHRDGANRKVTPISSILGMEGTAKELVLWDVPLVHLGIFAEGTPNVYGIFGARRSAHNDLWELNAIMLEEDVDGALLTYDEFERVNRRCIEELGVKQPKPLEWPPKRASHEM